MPSPGLLALKVIATTIVLAIASPHFQPANTGLEMINSTLWIAIALFATVCIWLRELK